MNYAPICVFAYNRSDHLLRLISSLHDNSLFAQSPLYVFVDGPRADRPDDVAKNAEVRRAAESIEHPRKQVIAADVNQGLANSIRGGVDLCLEQFDRIIVLEDDLILDQHCLEYMNSALSRYEENSRVMQVSGFAFPLEERNKTDTAYFLPFVTSWGWATWRDRWKACPWQSKSAVSAIDRYPGLRTRFNLDDSYDYSRMLRLQDRGKIDSWAILWNWYVFSQEGIVLYPPSTLIVNLGFDGSGTHGRRDISDRIHQNTSSSWPFDFPTHLRVNVENYGQITSHLRQLGKKRLSDIPSFLSRVLRRAWKG